jgi:hypothetical protein
MTKPTIWMHLRQRRVLATVEMLMLTMLVVVEAGMRRRRTP